MKKSVSYEIRNLNMKLVIFLDESRGAANKGRTPKIKLTEGTK